MVYGISHVDIMTNFNNVLFYTNLTKDGWWVDRKQFSIGFQLCS
jgi:hypothetical protein